ncbi:type VI secretion system-associated protein TagO [Rubellimicrobium roseum]|uniref:Type VI secretion system-associated protein TagO n=1 Tax=Rubellimicrobium roseum TaxID=687525 RepID=A0A5C4N4U9_9RHOB|nr:type VI secretion system-associated protein TagO [Rubellimicrobium roseum]TNC63538.1 hypothetical protein FHG71_19335 [Rubellimicrobium roseum]
MRWRTGPAVLAALLATTPVAGATETEGCAAIAADAERLACFDAQFGERVHADEGAALPADTGRWTIRTGVSPMTDETSVFLGLDSQNPIPSPFGGIAPGVLMLRCQENTTAAFVSFNDNVMADLQGQGRVEYRIDDQPMARLGMSASPNGLALGLWTGGRSIPWITSLIGHERLALRATPLRASPLTLTFDLSGLEAAIVGLRETCGW